MLGDYHEALARDLDTPPPTAASTPPTDEEKALLAQIIQAPREDVARHAFAELAAERGDPRAEMIEAQYAELAAQAAGEIIEATKHLERAHALVLSQSEWSAPLIELGARDVKFRRGFPEEITIDAEPLLAHWVDLFARAPLLSLHVRSAAGHVGELVRSELLDMVVSLDLDGQGVIDDDLVALAASPHVVWLQRLDLRHNPITARGIEALAASQDLGALQTITLDGNPASPIDQLESSDETHQHLVPTAAGQALEAKYGPLRWLHPEPPP